MRKIFLFIFSVGIAFFFLISMHLSGEECTTAVISSGATADGAPLLWKNRDTGELYNKVIFVKEKPYSYLALVNGEDTSGRWVYAGINSAGFAIINSVAYNLPSNPRETSDLEGIIMADALRNCASADDFENYLRKNLGPHLGSLANYGIIDATGGAAVFEVYNHGYRRLNAEDFPEKYIVNTNFARSGKPYKGAGYIRFQRASELFKRVKKLSYNYILQNVTRDIGNPLLPVPPVENWKEISPDKPFWIYTGDSIDRSITASAVVFHGVKKGRNPDKSTMWVILGEPLCSMAVPLWVRVGEPPAALWDGDVAPILRESMRLKALLRPLKGGDRKRYLDLIRLENKKGRGWLPIILRKEREILKRTDEFLEKNPSPSELEKFEGQIASEALLTLKSIH